MKNGRLKDEGRISTGAAVGKKFLLSLFLCALAASWVFADDSRIALPFFAEGRKLAQTGATEEALRLLASAILLRPDYADALFLKSRLLAAEEGEYRKNALEAARRAVRAGTWEFYSSREGAVHLARLLADTRSYREALELLDTLEAPPAAEEYEIRLRCYRGLGDKKKLEDTLGAALAAFPHETVFLEFFFKTADPLRPETVRRFELLDKSEAGNLRARAAYIQAAADSDGVLQLAWDYFRAGGKDPAVSCLLIEKGLVDPVREIERFVAFGGLERMGLVRKIAAATRTGWPQLLADTLASFSGRSILDSDGDGIPEEKFFIKAGKLILWQIDEDQDGLDEISMDFPEDQPGSRSAFPFRVNYRAQAWSMILNYREYPYVDESLYHEGGLYPDDISRTLRSRILPGKLAVPIIADAQPAAGAPEWLDYRLNREMAALTRETVESAAYMYEERNSREPAYVQEVFLADGKVRRIDVRYAGGKNGVVVHRLMFEEGRLSLGLRDLDRDGTFDVREFFEDGKLARLSIDTQGDGKPDYTESFFPELVKEWDIDADGIIDAREVSGPDGPPRSRYAIPFERYYGGAE
ncbi:MAG: hypothetical protein LBQ57_12910 [Spirochaetales bacterium]|jgi:hypothetical protein|nr:hypothetical protein [Spirochaetales bacterium]